MFVSPQEVKQSVVKLSYNSGLRRVGTSSYGLERTATITLFPAEGRSVDDVMKLQVARVQRQYTGDEAAPLKTAIGTSVWVSYFNAKRGWHMGREICVVPHQGYMVVYEVGGTKGQFEEGYSQVESLTGVIHGLKK